MKVSIIVPVYNEAQTAATLLERVRAQPLPGGATKEIIIVESNSTDGSREIVANFQAREAQRGLRVQAIYQERPRGKGHAVREGLAAATGDILMIQADHRGARVLRIGKPPCGRT
jgi:glycosyltransferase involved in cell wall biosynthesis